MRLLGSDASPVPSGESGGPAFFRGMGTSTIVVSSDYSSEGIKTHRSDNPK